MKSNRELAIFAAQIRMTTLRGLRRIGAGHIGGSMSMAELMAVLYGGEMRIDPQNPGWTGRDWLVVSKGHCGPAVYASLALRGYFPLEEIETINQPGTRLPSHCDRNLTPGIDMSTGSLGQGMSTALGVAWGQRYQNRDNYTYLVLGDGECDEGQVWEGALAANQQKLDHLIAFVDRNGKQLDGLTEDVCDLGDLRAKFEQFGWDAQEIDGNDVAAIRAAVARAKTVAGKPHMIVLNTVKGKDCTFCEDVFYNHHVKFTPEQYGEAIAALQNKIDVLEKEAEA